MKILIVSNGFPPTAYGGVEVYSYDMARELQRGGHQVWIFCRDSRPDRPDHEVIRETVEGVPVARVVNDFKQIRTFRRFFADEEIEQIFADLLDEYQPNLVHFNHFLALSASLPRETARRRIPSIITLHDYWTICQRINLVNSEHELCPGPGQGADCYKCMIANPVRGGGMIGLAKRVLPYPVRVVLRRLLGRPAEAKVLLPTARDIFVEREHLFKEALTTAARVVVPSGFVRKMMGENGFPANQIQVVPLGIGSQTPQARSAKDGKVHFGFVGSVIPLKGLESLIRAFRSVKDANICLDIYGRDDIQPMFTNHVRSLAKGDQRIVFRGAFRPDLRAEVFAKIDVLVMPSVWHETFSLVAREALLSGAPVIAARVGALTEIIEDGVNGFTYPPGDESALSALINRIAENPALLGTLEAPGSVEMISVSEHTARMEQIYQEVWDEHVLAHLEGKPVG